MELDKNKVSLPLIVTRGFIMFPHNNASLDIIKEESEYGARPIIRAIQTEIEEPLTDIILDNDENKIFNLELIDNKINFNIIKGDS